MFEAYARRLQVPRLFLACLRAGQRRSALVTAPRAFCAHHAHRSRRRVMGCRYGSRQLVAPVCGERRVARAARIYRRSRHVATGMCGVWKVYRVRGAGAEASESTRALSEPGSLNEIAWLQVGIPVADVVLPSGWEASDDQRHAGETRPNEGGGARGRARGLELGPRSCSVVGSSDESLVRGVIALAPELSDARAATSIHLAIFSCML